MKPLDFITLLHKIYHCNTFVVDSISYRELLLVHESKYSVSCYYDKFICWKLIMDRAELDCYMPKIIANRYEQ